MNSTDPRHYLHPDHPVLAMITEDLDALVAQGFTAVMYADAKERWIIDLMTTKVPQCKEQLAHCASGGFCCLGRLTAVTVGVTLDPVREAFVRGGQCLVPQDEGELPRATVKWAGVVNIAPLRATGRVRFGGNILLGAAYASDWNDSKNKTFMEIAELVERHVYAVKRPCLP